eukprot:2303507-Rhodomonas_salina.2
MPSTDVAYGHARSVLAQEGFSLVVSTETSEIFVHMRLRRVEGFKIRMEKVRVGVLAKYCQYEVASARREVQRARHRVQSARRGAWS